MTGFREYIGLLFKKNWRFDNQWNDSTSPIEHSTSPLKVNIKENY